MEGEIRYKYMNQFTNSPTYLSYGMIQEETYHIFYPVCERYLGIRQIYSTLRISKQTKI
jgi:hypothetical protein